MSSNNKGKTAWVVYWDYFDYPPDKYTPKGYKPGQAVMILDGRLSKDKASRIVQEYYKVNTLNTLEKLWHIRTTTSLLCETTDNLQGFSIGHQPILRAEHVQGLKTSKKQADNNPLIMRFRTSSIVCKCGSNHSLSEMLKCSYESIGYNEVTYTEKYDANTGDLLTATHVLGKRVETDKRDNTIRRNLFTKLLP